MLTVDIDTVGQVIREATATRIAPRFRALDTAEIEEKAPGETVTVADREAEDFITQRLQELLPGAPVIGEEAVSDDPDLLHALTDAPSAWLVDPLDGTSNFANGDPHWATMIALVHNGETVSSWIYRHGDDCLYSAELGSGAWCEGERVTCSPRHQHLGEMRGAILHRFLTDEEQARMLPLFPRFGAVLPGYSCAGYEYPAVITGEQDFALFQRLMPWDHAPGALLLAEAGGVARCTNGTGYRPSTEGRGLLLADSESTWELVHGVLYADIASAP
jgi:fructose-1,6-bisphosphatase/inositol monophosphatase family enzyme